MTPFIVGEISAAIKKLVRSLTEYEFDLNVISDDEGELPNEEEKNKTISLKGIIWKELGKDAYKEWHSYFDLKANTLNSLMLIMIMFRQLLEGALIRIEEAEHNYEKIKPKQAKLSHKRDVRSHNV